MAADNFNTDANPLASPWTTPGGGFNGLKALSGVAVPITASSDSASRYANSASKISRVTVGAAGDGDGGPSVFDSSGNGYTAILHLGGINCGLARWDAGGFINLGTGGGAAVANGDVVEIDVSTTSVVMRVNGVVRHTAADNTYRANLNPGIFIFGTPTFTDWSDGLTFAANPLRRTPKKGTNPRNYAPRQTGYRSGFPQIAAAGLSVDATQAALTITANAASVSRGRTANATTAALTITANAASVSLGRTINATTAALTLNAFAATVSGGGRLVDATTAALTFAAQQASVITGRTVNATTATLTLEAQPATVTLGESVIGAPAPRGHRIVRINIMREPIERVIVKRVPRPRARRAQSLDTKQAQPITYDAQVSQHAPFDSAPYEQAAELVLELALTNTLKRVTRSVTHRLRR